MFIKLFQSSVSNIQMFLFLLALLTTTSALLQGPLGYCMGNCASCDPYALARCRGSKPCIQGFYQPSPNGNCIISPSLQLVQHELGQRVQLHQLPPRSGWGHDKNIQCQYPSLASKQIIDVLGFFDTVFSIQKSYELPLNTEMVDFSFTLVRDQWSPEDFLMLQAITDKATSEIYDIYDGKGKDITKQLANVTCQRRRVFLQNYRIRIANVKGNKLKIVFNSFIFSAGVWGITNIKLLTGCLGFSSLDTTGTKCSQCAPGTYYDQIIKGEGQCISCPELCKTCKKGICQSCKWGQLKNGACSPPQKYKKQQINLLETSSCKNLVLTLNAKYQSLTLPVLNNSHNHLYDEVVLSLTIYYDIELVQVGVEPKLILYVNGQNVFTATANPQVNYTQECLLFKSTRVAKWAILTHPLAVNDNSLLIAAQINGVSRFGIAEAIVYSIKKEVSPPPQQPQETELPEPKPQVQRSSTDFGQGNGPQIIKSQTKMKVSAHNSTGSPTTPPQIRFDNNADALSDQSTYAITSKGLLQISIKNVPAIQGLLHLQIIPITPNDYNLVDSFYHQQDLILVINISRSFIDGRVTVKQVSVPRRLQAGTTQVVGNVYIPRFDSYSHQQLKNIAQFSVLFKVLAWMTILGMFMAVLSGYGIVIEEHLITMQLIYLHVYIGYDLLPLAFREAVSQFRTVGFLHFIPEKMVATDWALTPEAMYWLSPEYFDFFHAMLPIVASLIIYAFWFLFLLFVKKWCLPHKIPDDSRSTLHKMADNIVCRVINFADSIWRYQFVSVLLICMIQFVSSTASHSPAQLSLAIITLILTSVWLTASEIHIRNQYYENQYSEFIYLFDDRYHSKIPLHSLPSRHHRLGYPIMRVCKSLFFVLVVTLVEVPILVLCGLIAANSLQIWYLLYNAIYSDKRMLTFKTGEISCLLLVQVLLLCVRFVYHFADSQLYMTWGYILSTVVLITTLLTLSRSICIIYLKYVQSKGVNFQQVDIDQKKLHTVRDV